MLPQPQYFSRTLQAEISLAAQELDSGLGSHLIAKCVCKGLCTNLEYVFPSPAVLYWATLSQQKLKGSVGLRESWAVCTAKTGKKPTSSELVQ